MPSVQQNKLDYRRRENLQMQNGNIKHNDNSMG